MKHFIVSVQDEDIEGLNRMLEFVPSAKIKPMSELGRKGGSAKSPAKTNANRIKALKRWENERLKKGQ